MSLQQQTKRTRTRVNAAIRLISALAILFALMRQHHLVSFVTIAASTLTTSAATVPSTNATPAQEDRCAINLWGLPRAFESLVLPSLIRNVILPNAKYNCDYFVHYYQLNQEASGRSGQGGAIHPEQVLLLKEQVLKAQPPNQRAPVVEFAVTPEADFWTQYQPLLDKIQHTKDPQGQHPLYFPWRARTYKNPATTNNVIKMWHSIQSVWQLMMQQSQNNNNDSNYNNNNNTIQYTQVAMIRSDVLYMSTLDLYEYGTSRVVIPAFGRHPVSDRVIVGPAQAVEIWATARFDKLDAHVQYMYEHHRGWGLHSERFVKFALLPAIEEALVSMRPVSNNSSSTVANNNNNNNNNVDDDEWIVEHPTLCFFRARADESVWVSDCEGPAKPSIRRHVLANYSDIKAAVESVLGRPCHGSVVPLSRAVRALNCTKIEVYHPQN